MARYCESKSYAPARQFKGGAWPSLRLPDLLNRQLYGSIVLRGQTAARARWRTFLRSVGPIHRSAASASRMLNLWIEWVAEGTGATPLQHGGLISSFAGRGRCLLALMGNL